MLRSHLGDGAFHVYARGVEGRAIFVDDDDRSFFVAQLGDCTRRFGWDVHAFCLMTTHHHLVVRTANATLSHALHRLHFLHAMHFNRRHGRVGHLFADRFAARKLETEESLVFACRYVVLNPVRAGLVDDAEDWPWGGWKYGRRVGLAA